MDTEEEIIKAAHCAGCGAGFNYVAEVKGPPRRRCNECRQRVRPTRAPKEVTICCAECQEQFTYTRHPGKGRNRIRCDECRTSRKVLEIYVTKTARQRLIEWRESKEESQNGLCAICGDPETTLNHRTGLPQKLSVDHNHTTGELRALLCTHCNIMIGQAREDPKILSAALSYLEAHTSGGNYKS